jgi:type III restriction enzyme
MDESDFLVVCNASNRAKLLAHFAAVKGDMVFKLDAVDAYERKLVKQIEVAAASVEGGHNKPYVRLLSVSNRRGVITAKVELDLRSGAGVSRQQVMVKD